MNKLIPFGAAALLTATMALATATPAAAQFNNHHFNHGPSWGWNHSGWNHSGHAPGWGYSGWGQGGGIGFGLGAGLLGFAAGAALASSASAYDDGDYDSGNYDDHVSACRATYRSYVERTDSYLGYDGYRHQCDL